MKSECKECSAAAKAWMAVGGLLTLGLVVLFVRELPSIRRELKIMRM